MAHESTLKMRGVIVGETDDGFVADMTHPERITGVRLPLGGLCVTREYPGYGSRTRITNHHAPDLEVGTGNQVVALVDVTNEPTGRMVRNPYARGWRDPFEIPETVRVGAAATRWGTTTE